MVRFSRSETPFSCGMYSKLVQCSMSLLASTSEKNLFLCHTWAASRSVHLSLFRNWFKAYRTSHLCFNEKLPRIIFETYVIKKRFSRPSALICLPVIVGRFIRFLDGSRWIFPNAHPSQNSCLNPSTLILICCYTFLTCRSSWWPNLSWSL